MKFLKKTAALLFCVALALSVMAVSAMADDEAELLAAAVSNADFAVTLVKQTATVLDRDTEPSGTADSYEIDKTTDVTFDIMLAYKGSDTTISAKTIEAFSFVFDTDNSGTGVAVTGNAVTINSVSIGKSNTQPNFYAFSSTDGTGDISAPTSSPAKIGEITFDFDDVADNTVVTPTIKDIRIQVRGVEISQQPADVSTDKAVYVNPTYTATFVEFEPDSNGLAKVKTSYTPATQDYTFTAGKTALTDAAAIPGYTFKGWIVTTDAYTSDTWAAYDTTATSAWTADKYYSKTSDWVTTGLTPVASDATGERTNINFIPVGATANSALIPTHMVGNITLTPVYTADSYTATFVAGDVKASFTGNNVTGLKSGSTTEREKSYTIEDLYNGSAVVDFLDIGYTDEAQNKTLTRKAYKFVGWTPSNTANGTAPTEGYAWVASEDIATYNTTKVIKTATAKHYGDVTFTANWEEDIYYEEVNYAYAGTGNVLILVGVPKGANYDANYTYKFDNNLMFVIPDSAAQRNQYVTTAQATAENNTNAIADKTAFTAANLGSDYVVFAYIAASASDESKIAIVENENAPAEGAQNVAVAYTGDVDGDGTFAIDDCGNVNTMLHDSASVVYSISNAAGVKSRLQADCATASGSNFGSIDDILTAYYAMGYAASSNTGNG